ncbi:MAG: choice-of-anchor J domain-containing protein [Promethearchaeota archaeon]
MKNRNKIFTWTLVCLAWFLISSTSAILIDNSSEKVSEKTEWVNNQPKEGDNSPITLEGQASGNLNENESPKPASTVIYTQNFDHGGSLPIGWTTLSAGETQYPWEMVLDSESDYHAECKSNHVILGENITEWLYNNMDYINCSGYTNLELEFYMDYDYGNGNEYAEVLYATTKTGGAFVQLQKWNSKDVVGTQIIDLSAADGDPKVHIAFRYHGTFDWYMKVDDVILRSGEQDDGDDDDDDDGNGSGDKKSGGGIGDGVVNFLLSPIGLITVGGIIAVGVIVIIVVWVVKKKNRR